MESVLNLSGMSGSILLLKSTYICCRTPLLLHAAPWPGHSLGKLVCQCSGRILCLATPSSSSLYLTAAFLSAMSRTANTTPNVLHRIYVTSYLRSINVHSHRSVNHSCGSFSTDTNSTRPNHILQNECFILHMQHELYILQLYWSLLGLPIRVGTIKEIWVPRRPWNWLSRLVACLLVLPSLQTVYHPSQIVTLVRQVTVYFVAQGSISHLIWKSSFRWIISQSINMMSSLPHSFSTTPI